MIPLMSQFHVINELAVHRPRIELERRRRRSENINIAVIGGHDIFAGSDGVPFIDNPS